MIYHPHTFLLSSDPLVSRFVSPKEQDRQTEKSRKKLILIDVSGFSKTLTRDMSKAILGFDEANCGGPCCVGSFNAFVALRRKAVACDVWEDVGKALAGEREPQPQTGSPGSRAPDIGGVLCRIPLLVSSFY